MKHVVLFSGGCSSAVVAGILIETVDSSQIVFLHTPTLTENDDSEKFRLKVARYLKIPMTVWGRGEDLWECIDRNNAIPGQFLGFCTVQLKQQMKEEYYQYLKSIGEDFIEYVGYGPDEYRRVQKSLARNEKLQREVRFPLFERGITSDECRRIIHDEWKIELPSAYEHLKHNNCIPCFKGGKDYFRAVWEFYPEQFWRAVAKEEQIGFTVFKDTTLRALAERFKNNKFMEDSQLTFEDLIPCECWT